MKQSEQQLTRQIIDAINASGLALVWRTPSGLIRLGKRAIVMAPKGTPDILGFLLNGSGRMLAIEVKLPGEVPSPCQADWLTLAQNKGVVAFWAVDVLDAMQQLGTTLNRLRRERLGLQRGLS